MDDDDFSQNRLKLILAIREIVKYTENCGIIGQMSVKLKLEFFKGR